MRKIIATVLLFSLFGCSNELMIESEPKITYPEIMPEDFDFRLDYGTYSKQVIDTFTDIVVKDLVVDNQIETIISLSDSEMQSIYNEMVKLNVMANLEVDRDMNCHCEPESISKWSIQMNGQTIGYHYSYCCDQSDVVEGFVELEQFIQEIVYSKESYKALPPAQGYYE